MYLLHLFYAFRLPVCLWTTCLPGTCGGQKKMLDSLELFTNSCETPCDSWKMNLHPLEEQLEH